jgi:hypothetical protein
MRVAVVMLLALLSAPSALAQSSIAWVEDSLDFETDTLIYRRPEALPRDPPPTMSRTRLFVPLTASASGPAAFQITLQRDCATGQETASYGEYAADGQEKSPAPAAPAALATFAFARDTDIAKWRDFCRSTRTPPAPGPSPGMKEVVDPLRIITATSVAEAIDRAHALLPAVEVARRYKNQGNFELLVINAPYARTLVVDAGAREQIGEVTRLSFVEPRGGPWSRVSYLVNCEAGTGKRELHAEFEANGDVDQVFGPTVEGPFDKLRFGAVLTQLCGWQPGATKRYYYLSDALRTANAER